MTIETIGVADIEVARLGLPDDWEAVCALPEVQDRADSIATTMLMHYPVVRKSDYRLIAGRKRVAAYVRLGRDTIRCLLVECSDAECELLEHTENAERTHDPVQQRVSRIKVVDLLANVLTEAPLPADAPKPRGRPKTAKGRSIEFLAKERGIKPHSVQVALARERKRERERLAKEAEKNGVLPPVDMTVVHAHESRAALSGLEIENPWGLPLNSAFVAQCRLAHMYIKTAEGQFKAGLSQLTQLENSGVPIDRIRIARAKDEISSASRAAVSQKPKGVCPYCKGLSNTAPKCGACCGRGYATEQQWKEVPEDFMATGDAAIVLWEGQKYPLSEFLAEPEEQRAREQQAAEEAVDAAAKRFDEAMAKVEQEEGLSNEEDFTL